MPSKFRLAAFALFACSQLLAWNARPAEAQEITNFYCTKSQDSCEVESKDLTVGDQLVFLDAKDKLLAKGRVTKLNLGRRYVQITKRWGPITRKSRIKVVDFDTKEKFEVFREGSKENFGVGFGLASYDIGTDVIGFELTGFYEKKVFRELRAMGRVGMITGSGVVTRPSQDISNSREDGDIRFSGFGTSGGISYIAFDGQDFSLRGELGGGFMYLSASVEGDTGDVADGGYSTGISHGFGWLARGEVAALVDLKFVTMQIYLSQNYIHNAVAPIFGVGIVRALE